MPLANLSADLQSFATDRDVGGRVGLTARRSGAAGSRPSLVAFLVCVLIVKPGTDGFKYLVGLRPGLQCSSLRFAT